MAKNIENSKDLLFSKLLPALSDNPFSSNYESSACLEEKEVIPENDAISALRSRLFGRDSSYTASEYATINVMESMVLKRIEQAVKRFNACGCDRCRSDIASHALTNLPPKYIVAHPQNLAKAESEIDQKLVLDAIVNAVLVIRSKPRH